MKMIRSDTVRSLLIENSFECILAQGYTLTEILEVLETLENPERGQTVYALRALAEILKPANNFTIPPEATWESLTNRAKSVASVLRNSGGYEHMLDDEDRKLVYQYS